MHRSRTALAAAFMALPLALAGCSDDGDVDVQPGNVEVTPPEADVDAPDVDAPDVDAPDVDADVDVETDGEASADADAEETPSG